MVFGRSLLTGALPPPSGDHDVVDVALALPGHRLAIQIHVWRPKTAHAASRFPIVLFAPGWGGFARDNALLVADLASRGYVVAAFDDIAHDPQEPDETAEQRNERAANLDVSSEAAFQLGARAAEARVRAETLKARRVLDGVETLVRGGHSAFRDADPKRIGFLGFSFGGCVGAETAFDDARIAAVANLDGRLFGQAVERGVPKPYLLMTSTQWFPSPGDAESTEGPRRVHAAWAKANMALHERSLGEEGVHWFAVESSLHGDFTDDFFHPSWRGALRRRWSYRVSLRAAINSVIAAFFDTYVGGQAAPLMRGGEPPRGIRRIRAGDRLDFGT